MKRKSNNILVKALLKSFQHNLKVEFQMAQSNFMAKFAKRKANWLQSDRVVNKKKQYRQGLNDVLRITFWFSKLAVALNLAQNLDSCQRYSTG